MKSAFRDPRTVTRDTMGMLRAHPGRKFEAEELAETDLSLIEQTAVLRLAATACEQANIVQEIALAMARNRGGPQK